MIRLYCGGVGRLHGPKKCSRYMWTFALSIINLKSSLCDDIHNIHVSSNKFEHINSYAIVSPRMMHITVRKQLYLFASVHHAENPLYMLHNIKAILTIPLNPVI